MPEIKRLRKKYLVIPIKYVKGTKSFKKSSRITLNHQYAIYHGIFSKDGMPYFVMKLEDEFNIGELIELLTKHYFNNKIKELDDCEIKGSDLALIILNSITDKSKLR